MRGRTTHKVALTYVIAWVIYTWLAIEFWLAATSGSMH